MLYCRPISLPALGPLACWPTSRWSQVAYLELRGLAPCSCLRRRTSACLWRSVLPVNYLDDTAIVVTAGAPPELLPRLMAVTTEFILACRANGLEVNFGPGKTEAILRMSGAGTAAANADLCALESELCGDAVVQKLPLDGHGSLRIVQHYRHLGAELSTS